MYRAAPAPANSVVKSVGRVLAVFEHLREVGKPMTATEIGRALEYPKSSTNALLKSLVTLGYLSFDRESLLYFPTLRLTHLGDWLPASLVGSPNTLNLLEALHEATGETITLSMQNDFSMQFLRVITGSFPISLRIGEGYMVPLFGTGVGTSLLASKTDPEIRTLVQRANSRIRRRADRIDLDKTLTEVQRTRRQGYCAAYDRLLAHTGAISMPLPATVDGSALVVAVAGLGDRIQRNEAQIIRTMRRLMTRHFPGRQIA